MRYVMVPGVMAAVLGAALLAAPAAARADAIGPPPQDCPAGTVGESCHGGPFCDPEECTGDSTCKDGKTCQAVKYCTRQLDCAGGWGKGPYYRTEVKGLCGINSTCASGGTCTSLKVCLSGAVAGDGGADTPARGCSCDLSGGAGTGLALWLIGLGLLIYLRRRG